MYIQETDPLIQKIELFSLELKLVYVILEKRKIKIIREYNESILEMQQNENFISKLLQ